MKQEMKRFMALLLSVMLVISMMPTSVFAEDELGDAEEVQVVEEEVVEEVEVEELPAVEEVPEEMPVEEPEEAPEETAVEVTEEIASEEKTEVSEEPSEMEEAIEAEPEEVVAEESETEAEVTKEVSEEETIETETEEIKESEAEIPEPEEKEAATEEAKVEEKDTEEETAAEEETETEESEEESEEIETEESEEDAEEAEESEEAPVAFDESKTVDGIKITVKAEEGAFPAGSTLSVRKVTASEERKAEAAVESERDENANVATSYTFDIKVLDKDGNEIQPAEGKKVEVLFKAEEIANENLETSVYHIKEEAGLVAESLDTTEKGDTVAAETDGFSYYTVEFTYGDFQYVMKGDTEIPLDTILDEIGLTGTVTKAVSSSPELFSVEQREGRWIVTALQAFCSNETLSLTIDGIDYVVKVTDSQHSHSSGSHGVSGTWQAWNNSTSLPTSGTYYLNTDVTVTASLAPAGNINLCLNGHKITVKYFRGIYDLRTTNYTITIYDSDDNSGVITTAEAGYDSYGAISIRPNSGYYPTVTLKGGTIKNCKYNYGAAVGINGDGGTFNMQGGVICNNTSSLHGAVWIGKGTFNMSGGTIRDNVNTSSSDGATAGVSTGANTPINISGGTITGNSVPNGKINQSGGGIHVHDKCTNFKISGKVNISGNTVGGKENNVFLYNDGALNVSGSLDASSIIGVTTRNVPSGDTTVKITSGLSGKGTAANFISDNPDYTVMIKNGEAHLNEHKHVFEYSAEGDTITATCVNTATDCSLEGHTATLKIIAPTLKVYGGSGSEKATLEGEIPGVTPPAIVYKKDGQTLSAAPKNAGTYTAEITLGTSPSEATASVDYTIKKADITPVVIIDNWNYGETPKTPSVTSASNPGGGAVTYKYYTDAECTTETGTAQGATTSGAVPSKGGNYWVKATVAETDNYKSGTGTKGFEIVATKITVTGLSFGSKVYDGTTTATLNIDNAQLEGVNPGDDVRIKSATGTFDTKDVGTEKTISNIVVELEGDDADGYIATADSITGAITKKAVVVEGITASNKVYDGNTTATVDTSEATFDGIVGDDQLTVSTAGSFSDKNVGEDKIVLFSALILGGASESNYKLADTGNQADTTANITPISVTISGITAQDKTYDGNTEATLVLDNAVINNKVENDDLSFTGSTGTFSDKNVENDKTVTITGVTLSGNDAANYELTSQPEATTANITKRPVTISGITAQDKVYDGNTEATLVYDDVVLDGLVGDDDLSVTATGTFSDKNVGTEKTVTISGLTLAGDDKDNYVLASEGQQTTTEASITKREITVSGIMSEGKVYDGNTDATTSLYYEDAKLIGKVDGEGECCDDKLGITATGTFPNEDYGVDKVITLAGLTLTGSEKDNYVLAATGQQETCIGDIDKYAVTVTAKNATKVYGEDDPEFEYEYTPDLVDDDEFEGALSRHTGENVGEYTITAGTLHDHNHNYAITYNHAKLTITQAPNSATVSIEGWTYGDEANEPSVTADFGEDTVTYTYSNAKEGTYTETVPTNAGTYYVKATIPGTTNYAGAESEPVEFVIAKKEVGLDWSNSSLTYTGENQAPTATATNLVNNDTCTVTVDGAKKDSNAKSGETSYTATANALNNDNYKLPENNTQSFTIAPKEIIVSGITANDKTYDQSADAELDLGAVVLAGKVENDNIDVSAKGQFADANAGMFKEVTISDLTLIGDDKDNYILAAEGQQTEAEASIRAKYVKVQAINGSKIYGQDDPTLEYTAEDLLPGDSYTGELRRDHGENVGTYGISQGGLTAGNNYSIEFTTALFTITQATENSVTVEIEGWTYGDAPNAPKATATFGLETATFTYSDAEDGDFTANVPENAGTWYVKATVPSTDNFVGAESDAVKFEIAKKEISKEMLTMKPDTIKADGEEKSPEIVMKDGDAEMVEGTDYVVSGDAKTDKVGTHFITIEGQGNYTGSFETSWEMYSERSGYQKEEAEGGRGELEIFVDIEGNTENVTVDNLTTDVAKTFLSEEELARYNAGEHVLIYVELFEEDKDAADTTEKELLAKKFKEIGAEDIRWFDISVWKKIGNDAAEQVHEIGTVLEMTIEVPSEHQKAEEGYTRTFYFGRAHDGKAEVIAETDKIKVKFSSDKFSTYALGFKDIENKKEEVEPGEGSGSESGEGSGESGTGEGTGSGNGSGTGEAGTGNGANGETGPLTGTPNLISGNPNTGDEHNIFAWIVIALMAIAAALIERRQYK